MSNQIDQAKINLIARGLGGKLIQIGSSLFRSGFNLNPKVYSRETIRTFLSNEGIKSLSLSDLKYYVDRWDVWQKFIASDWLNYRKYVTDRFDCDNFAFLFASRAANIVTLNTCGVCYGTINSPKTGQLLGYHAFNLIVALNNGILVPFLYEPMNDGWTVWDKKANNIIGNWVYKINWIIMF